jgi:hypothetical protein
MPAIGISEIGLVNVRAINRSFLADHLLMSHYVQSGPDLGCLP